MDEQDSPAAHIVATLKGFGVETDDVDVAVIGAAWEQFGPGMRALLAADLAAIEPEGDFDPSQPPGA
jgi:hypothetical protein